VPILLQKDFARPEAARVDPEMVDLDHLPGIGTANLRLAAEAFSDSRHHC
jgi:hypothetical protein